MLMGVPVTLGVTLKEVVRQIYPVVAMQDVTRKVVLRVIWFVIATPVDVTR